MQIPLPVDQPSLVVIQCVFGSTLGTVLVRQGSALHEAPVVFGAEQAVGDYGRLMDAAASALLPVGASLRGLLAETGAGGFQDVPTLEIFIGTSDQTVGEYFVAQGWAIPVADRLAHHPRRQHYLDAVRAARASHAGIWGETGISPAQLGLSVALAAETAPPPTLEPWIVELALVGVLVLAILIGVRERHDGPQPKPPSPPRDRPARRFGLGLIGTGLGWYVGGALPPRSRRAMAAAVAGVAGGMTAETAASSAAPSTGGGASAAASPAASSAGVVKDSQ